MAPARNSHKMEIGQVRENFSMRWPNPYRVVGWLSGLVVGSVFAACSSLPSMDQQEWLVRENSILVHRLTAPAIVNIWGKPSYHHAEYTQFFVMKDQSMVPRSRVPVGEAPAGWEAGFDVGEGVFFAYPDRGWLLVFVDDELVYREELQADQLHKLGKAWQHETQFKTHIERSAAP